jgi:hypothetical protein
VRNIRWGIEEFIRLTGESTAIAVELIEEAKGEIHVALERYYQIYGDDNLGGVDKEVAQLNSQLAALDPED